MAKPHCPVCGYTKEDAALWLDHNLCKGKISNQGKPAKKQKVSKGWNSKQLSDSYEASENWWRKDGIYIDPDTKDVDWYDKRAELAKIAFMAGAAWSRKENV